MPDEGEYVKVGDAWEWRWNDGAEPKVEVPEGEYDPRDPAPAKKTATKPAPKDSAEKATG